MESWLVWTGSFEILAEILNQSQYFLPAVVVVAAAAAAVAMLDVFVEPVACLGVEVSSAGLSSAGSSTGYRGAWPLLSSYVTLVFLTVMIEMVSKK